MPDDPVSDILDRLLSRRCSKDPVGAAEQMLRTGCWQLPDGSGFGLFDDWARARDLPRSVQRLLHSHGFVVDMAAAHQTASNPEALRLAIRAIERWRTEHSPDGGQGNMAFHDECVARRLTSWQQLQMILTREGMASEAEQVLVWMKEEFGLLARADFHAGANNHGMFQDLALVYYCLGYPDDARTAAVSQEALSRLRDYFQSSVSEDGVHKEHSPAYHSLIAGNIRSHLLMFQHLDPELEAELRQLLEKMSPFAVNIVTPDRQLPPIGDTVAGPVTKSYYRLFCAGERSVQPSAVFLKGGYAILRANPGAARNQLYAVICASDHGVYHKHQDDLSVLLHFNRWILVEAGPYGYDYANPLSIHGYSSAAHNCIVHDGQPRLRSNTPYVPGRVYLSDFSDDGASAMVEGVSLKTAGSIHRRRVTLHRDSRRLEIEDCVENTTARTHLALWHLGPTVEPRMQGLNVELTAESKGVGSIRFESDSPVELVVSRGDGPGVMKGLIFPRMGQVADTFVLGCQTQGPVDQWRITTTIELVDVPNPGRSASAAKKPRAKAHSD
ncbi:MAG: alginate lyase family protein [Polyangiaceae bacterium]|nr:alginate lyase family protein [Polyangiaceae bacterium]